MAECHNTPLEEGSRTQNTWDRSEKTKPRIKVKMFMCMDIKKREAIKAGDYKK